MDPKSVTLLEFPLVRARLAEATQFPPSRRLAESLEPSADPVIVARGLQETDEARALLRERPGVGIGGAHDIGPAVGRAARGGRLDAAQFVAIAETLEAASRLGDALAGERRPLLRDLGRAIQPLPALRSVLERTFDPAGELLDSASPRLGGLRRAVRIAYERLRARLDTLVHSSELGAVLQEPIITLRNGRYVVPVRAEARGRVKGIVHDASGSGQTVFVEPLIAVELGNVWREAQLAEQVEIERILDELSALVGANGPALGATVDALARFDLWSAKARLAGEMDATRAETTDSPRIVLRSARHPGLSGRVVPIDVELGGEFTALVVTGPNTGGKTVTLRTIGLLCLMHQAGLHVPAEAGSSLPVLRDVFADIGDEQSVAQSLSTFSGHLRSITRIVGAAGPDTLVLLDELGAGTDPTEGSALAQALLDHFIRSGALVAATTHYAELKVYAHATPQARNASVEFDLETLSPTYRVSIGLPGTSHAFQIAERLGLPTAIVDDARSRLSEGQVAFEETLASIRRHEGEAIDALARARAAEARASEARRQADEERRRARAERDDAVKAARLETERIVSSLRDEVRAARKRLEREALTTSGLDRLERTADEHLAQLPATEETVPEVEPPADVAWRVGMRARSRTRGWDGRIAALDRGGRRATLEVGGIRVTVETDDLVPAGAAPEPAHPSRRTDAESSSASIPRLRLDRARTVASSLDLRGARVEEAIEMLGRYLDDAAVAGLERTTIVHGLGTGALRDAVRSSVAASPLVRTWRPGARGEGGDGATIVEL
jgi:DNA mismatch repair protein MutS2